MLMASQTLCMNSQIAGELGAESTIHSNSDQAKCQNSFSCSYGHSRKSKGANDTLSHNGSCIEQNKIVRSDDVACNSKALEIVSESGADRCILNSGNNISADRSSCLHGEHGGCEAANATDLQQYLRLQKGSTFQDLYLQEHYDDEDNDDSDWEPVNHLMIRKWFCTNCTMPNFNDVCHCDVCGEHKESEISGYHTFLSGIEKTAQMSIDSDGVLSYQESSSEIRTAIGFDERMLLHSEVEMKSHPHPERPDRLRAIAASLATAGIFPGKCSLIPAREITHEELELVHSGDHIETVQQTSHMLSSYFTSDTYANEHSARAARIAAGFCADLALSIMSGRTRNGFALVRPPGHHAGVKEAMGFCLHNNAAVAALAAQTAGAKKVLIVDWDVHHGNGTQEIFEGNKSVLYVSLHRHEGGSFYPGTGAAGEVGTMDGKGYSVNIPWSCGGIGDNDYIFAFQHIVLPIASEFGPDITIISAGFDAARGDPLGGCDVTPAGYAQMAYMLTAFSQGRILAILEGGYNLRSISSSATAVVKVLLGENPGYQMNNIMPSKAGFQTVLQVLQIQLNFWSVLKSRYIELNSQWELVSTNTRKQVKRRKRFIGPIWWKWGSKRFVYEQLYGAPCKARRRAKRIRWSQMPEPA
ncbi:histone deacetylase 15-like isoform X2 [Iris pallida]|uniref:histone deacetylase n=1 Tax=Iris pallida TaxID=29817 RepID=A0AAX6DXJ7_IRIPA|nr:histone deacetylase 15-like isoform X2 [Iris pallida]